MSYERGFNLYVASIITDASAQIIKYVTCRFTDLYHLTKLPQTL